MVPYQYQPRKGKKRLLAVHIVRHEGICVIRCLINDAPGSTLRSTLIGKDDLTRSSAPASARWNAGSVSSSLYTGMTIEMSTRALSKPDAREILFNRRERSSPAPGRYGNGLTRYSATVETTLPSRKATSAPPMIFMGSKTSRSVFYGRIEAAPGGPVPTPHRAVRFSPKA
jgi:hypothetical protein